MTNRKSFTELASSGELDQMLQLEAKRQYLQGKFFPDFTTVINWVKHLDLPTGLFTDSTDRYEISQLASELKPKVIDETLQRFGKGDDGLVDLLNDVTQYLGEEDPLERSVDLILVFGSGDEGRIEKGVELFKEGLSNRIVITGGRPHYGDEQLPEALQFARHALNLGIPKENILIEPNSINIRDNIKSTLNMLELFEIPYSRGIVTITAWFAQRRVWSNLQRWIEPDVAIYRVNSVIDTGRLAPDQWFNNELGLNVIFNEFVKMNISFHTRDKI